jgi:DNA-binding MarR family transcriptional regulator
MSNDDESATAEPSLLALLSDAAQSQREALLAGLRKRGVVDVTLADLRLLSELKQPASIQTLADATSTTKQFCARQVHKLVEKGYARIDASDDDRRIALVARDKSATKLLAAAKATKLRMDADLVRRIGAGEVQALRRTLAKLID